MPLFNESERSDLSRKTRAQVDTQQRSFLNSLCQKYLLCTMDDLLNHIDALVPKLIQKIRNSGNAKVIERLDLAWYKIKDRGYGVHSPDMFDIARGQAAETLSYLYKSIYKDICSISEYIAEWAKEKYSDNRLLAYFEIRESTDEHMDSGIKNTAHAWYSEVRVVLTQTLTFILCLSYNI